tara:strand:- start:2915 stop:3538 length:624 start_codon:yes stop_codon:yes gene_type:complete
MLDKNEKDYMKSQILIGLTGCIAMGKSTTLKMFTRKGVKSWCADEAVTRLYDIGGAAVEYVKKISPESIIKDSVSKVLLRKEIEKRPGLLRQLESFFVPLLKRDRENFLSLNSREKVLVFDIPLLFENNMENEFDIVITVSVSEKTQKDRVLSRKTMDEPLFNLIKSKQLSDKEKRQKADYIFETTSLEKINREIDALLEKISLGNA